MSVHFHCSKCSKVPANYSSEPKIHRFFIISSGVLSIFLILGFTLPSLPAFAMVTMICLGSIFVATTIVFEVINYFEKIKRQKREDEAIQSKFQQVEEAIAKLQTRESLSTEPFLNFINSESTIQSHAQCVIDRLHAAIPIDKHKPYFLELLKKYPRGKKICTMKELLNYKRDVLSCNLQYYTAIRDESLQKYCSLASISLIMQRIFNLNYQAHLFYENHQISQDKNWENLIMATQNAGFAQLIAIKQDADKHEEILFPLIFHYMKAQEKQMISIWKKIKQRN